VNADTLMSLPMEKAALFSECWPSYIYGEDSYGHIVVVERLKDFKLVSQ